MGERGKRLVRVSDEAGMKRDSYEFEKSSLQIQKVVIELAGYGAKEGGSNYQVKEKTRIRHTKIKNKA